MLMGAIEPNLLQFLHQTELHLDELFQGQVEEDTVFMLPLVAKRKRIPQMLSLKGPASSSASAPAPRNKCEYNSQNSQNFRARPAHSQGSKTQGGTKTPACVKCCKSHSGVCRDGSTSCFKGGQNGHFMRKCPMNMKSNGNGGNRAHSSSVAPPDRAASR
ncbi:hypothetical protein MTR67_052433 [Solanum verrucosum]|uniref:Gag-pol polyprotein n=1 Tax=Solanum verrucosum TaxID=315347 RepID=A0AAF0V522_SOLVR|nr:hypothetical protein MTR67_052433 [Solanum verrucosum]